MILPDVITPRLVLTPCPRKMPPPLPRISEGVGQQARPRAKMRSWEDWRPFFAQALAQALGAGPPSSAMSPGHHGARTAGRRMVRATLDASVHGQRPDSCRVAL